MAHLDNADIAALFVEMADLTEIAGGDSFRVSSFRRASRVLENLPQGVGQMLRFGTLDKRYGIGPGTVHRVKAILRTGTCDDLKLLRTQFPSGIRELLGVKGLGPKTIRKIHHNLGISSLAELEYAALNGQLMTIPRMGPGTVHRILKGIEDFHKRRGKTPLSAAQRIGGAMVEGIKDVTGVSRVELAGSVRRGKATIGDLDILVAADEPQGVVSAFVRLPQVDDVLIHGTGRCMVRLVTGQQMDLRLIPPEEFGAGLHYFTGSKLHNIAMRMRANKMGIKISDHGIFKRPEETRIATGETEEEIFRAVGLPWIPPELRENTGEMQAALEGKLPRLVSSRDLRSDLHMHTTDSDGNDSIMGMGRAALAQGLRAIAITDHSRAVGVTKGLDEAGLIAQRARIRAAEAQLLGLTVLSGIEVDILPNGDLDLDPEVLRGQDWVIASVHLRTDMPPGQMTDRIIRAMETGVVDCIGHPTGRRPGKRSGVALDLDRVLRAARRLGVFLECNGGPGRMDLPDVACRQAREAGVPIAVNTDAHSARHVGQFDYGLAMARRGWLEPRHVVNTWPVETIKSLRAERLRSGSVAVSMVRIDATVGEGETGEDDDDVNAWSQLERDEADMVVMEVKGPVSLELPLSEAVRERIVAFLQGEPDGPLEEALGENPIQVAYNLLLG